MTSAIHGSSPSLCLNLLNCKNSRIVASVLDIQPIPFFMNTNQSFLDHLAALIGPLPSKGWFRSGRHSFNVNPPLKFLEHLRIACDLMNFYFAFDEYTDVANKTEATKIANDVMAAFRDRKASIQLPHSKITTMAQQ